MGTSVFDSDLLKDAWSTEEMRGVFNDAARMRRRLEVEAAMKGLETGLTVRQALPENTVIRNALSDAKLDRLPDPDTLCRRGAGNCRSDDCRGPAGRPGAA